MTRGAKFDDRLYRGITIAASPPVVFRWLCQMRVAPYSYDWIDNGGHLRPPTLMPGLDDPAHGQPPTTPGYGENAPGRISFKPYRLASASAFAVESGRGGRPRRADCRARRTR